MRAAAGQAAAAGCPARLVFGPVAGEAAGERLRRSWSTRPVTTGAIAASQSSPGPAHAPASTGPRAVPPRPRSGPSRARTGRANPGGRYGRPGRPIPPSSWSSDRCSCSRTGCPARSGRHPAPSSRTHASSSASCWRCCTGAGVLGAHLLAQGVQHRLQRGGAPGGQVPGEPAWRRRRWCRAAGRGGKNPSSPSSSGPATRRRISSASCASPARSAPPAAAASKITSASGRASAGRASVQSVICRAHDTDNTPAGERLRDRGMVLQPPHPAHRPAGRTRGDPGLPGQPRPRRPLPVIFEPALRAERRQHPRPGGRMHRLRHAPAPAAPPPAPAPASDARSA